MAPMPGIFSPFTIRTHEGLDVAYVALARIKPRSTSKTLPVVTRNAHQFQRRRSLRSQHVSNRVDSGVQHLLAATQPAANDAPARVPHPQALQIPTNLVETPLGICQQFRQHRPVQPH